jgi:hypothetical protein
MSRTALHLRFILGTLGIGVLLTVLMMPLLEAGHASAVVAVVPALLLGHLLFAPALLGAKRTTGGRLGATAAALGVFLATSALFWLGSGALEALFDRVEQSGGDSYAIVTGVMLALPVLFVAISSVILELVWRTRDIGQEADGQPG